VAKKHVRLRSRLGFGPGPADRTIRDHVGAICRKGFRSGEERAARRALEHVRRRSTRRISGKTMGQYGHFEGFDPVTPKRVDKAP